MKAKGRSQRVVIEYSPTLGAGSWWVMLADGTVISGAESPVEALESVMNAARKGNPGVTTTRIEWRNTPDGFVTPTTKDVEQLKKTRAAYQRARRTS